MQTTRDVSSAKVGSFHAAPIRKSKQERERDAAVKKKREEDEDSSKAYEEFVAAFGVEAEDAGAGGRYRTAGKAFVRSKAMGEGVYDPMAAMAAAAAAIPPPPPTAPSSMLKRPTAAALFDDDEV